MSKFWTFITIFFAVLNLVFAGINYYRINQVYINPDEKKRLKDLKSVKDFSLHVIVIFFLQLITIVYASMKEK
jgi:hypothetical protein